MHIYIYIYIHTYYIYYIYAVSEKNLLNFMTRQFFIKIISFDISLETFSYLHYFILTNFILKHTKWPNCQKTYNNNLINETKL